MNDGRERRLLVEITERANQIKAIWDKVGDAPIDEATKKQAMDLENEIAAREQEIKAIREQDELRQKNDARLRNLGVPQERPGLAGERNVNAAPKSIGHQVVEAQAFKTWLDSIKVEGGRIPEKMRVQSPPIQLKTLLTGASSTSAGALVVNERTNIIDMGTFYRPLTIMSLLTMGTTNSDTVEYVRQGTHTNNAAPTAEATATGDGTGAKPESAMALSIVTEVVKTVAHWIPATRRALADAGQLRTLIDSFLRYGLEEEMEDQILNGNGLGENFTGIYNTTGTSTQAYDTDLLTTTRKARTKVGTSGRGTPTGFLMHPTDWEAFDLLKDNEARYFFGGPSAIGTPRLWGLPVIESEANASGAALVADWRLAALWMREQSQILVSDSHSDFFVRNLIAILAEERAAFGVIRPAAFVEIDLTP